MDLRFDHSFGIVEGEFGNKLHKRSSIASVYVMRFLEVPCDGLGLNRILAGGADYHIVEGEMQD
jgi:hypothetical protein